MKKCNALVILPYSGLENVFTKAQANFQDISLTFYLQNPEKLKTAAMQETLKKKYDLMITHLRYSTPEYTAGLPISCLHLAFSDLFYALKSVEHISGRHAFVTHMLNNKSELTEYAQKIGEFLRGQTDFYNTDENTDINALLEQLKKANYSVIIGGQETVDLAKKVGINAIQIPYGVESVRNALETARAIYETKKRQTEHYQIYQDLLNEVSDYIALQDSDGNILYHNGSRSQQEFDSLVGAYQDMDDENSLVNFELEHKGIVWSVTKKNSLTIGPQYTLICFHRLRYVDASSGGAITYLSAPPSSIIANIYKFSDYANMKERLEWYQNAEEPTLISGERGLGKECLAFLLNGERPMIRIDCNNLTLDSFQIFKEEGFRRVNETDIAAVLLVNADVISAELQEEMADFLEIVNQQRKIRIISTAWDEIYRKVSRGDFSSRLYHLLSKICIDIPPLCQVISNMDYEISQIISDLNIELGRQVVGISPEAVDALKDFDWSANLQQLIDILRRTMLAVNSAYIGKDDIQRIIETEKNLWGTSRGAAAFWKGDLEEIERRIIRGILEAEGMNQAKAAKRLGISRSTLWRKIK